MQYFAHFATAVIVATLAAACTGAPAALEIQTGTDVSLERTDGATVAGRLVDVQPQEVVIEDADGRRTRVLRSEIRAIRASTAASSVTAAAAPPAAPTPPDAPKPDESMPAESRRPARAASAPAARSASALEKAAAGAPRVPAYRDLQIPAGTVLPIELGTTVGSATSQVEDQVRGTVRRAIDIDGIEVIPAGATVLGTVTEAERSGRVKGRARVAFRFALLDLPEDGVRIPIRTGAIAREAEATKKQDAAKIGGGAAAGAVIGGILGGGDGAAKGAAIGGGAGTGVVLSTRGKEVTLPAGTAVSAKLLEPVAIRVKLQ